MNLSLEIEWEHPDGEFRRAIVEVTYKPSRPPPRCSDPDHSAFSDPGDPDELEIVSAMFEDGTPVPQQARDAERFIDALYDEARCETEGSDRG